MFAQFNMFVSHPPTPLHTPPPLRSAYCCMAASITRFLRSNSIDRECASVLEHIFQCGSFQIADRLKFSRPRQSCVSARSTDDFIRFRIFGESRTLYYTFLLLLSAYASHMTNRTHRTLRLYDTMIHSTAQSTRTNINTSKINCDSAVRCARNGISRSVHRVRCAHTNARHTNSSKEYMRNGALHGHTIAAPSPRFSHRIQQTNNKMVYRSDRCRSEYSFAHS